MRSEMVFAAKQSLPDRYKLCRVVATATRKFHKPATRIEDTTDAVLLRIANSNAEAVCLNNATIAQVDKTAR